MAGKFGPRLSSPSVLLLCAVFIILSGGAAEGRQCYWCGPLAEQVHRSRRAPPCAAAARLVTVCEPGHDHCAVVATSPPYTESRFCVKLYQDECHPLFCNTTKSWRMTCPCRGDLCNGAPTEREEDAFAVLAKLVAKTHSHIKKRTAQLTENRIKTIVSPAEELPLDGNTVEEAASQSNTNENDPLTTNTVTYNDQTPEITATENKLTASEDEENKLKAVPTTPMMIEIDIIQKPTNYIPVTSKTTIQDEDFQADEPVQQDQPKVDNINAMDDVKELNKESDPKEESKMDDTTTESPKVQHSTKETITSTAPEDKTDMINIPSVPTNIEPLTEKVDQSFNEVKTSSAGSAPVSSAIPPETTNNMASKITSVNTTKPSKMNSKNYATKISVPNFFVYNFCILIIVIKI